MTPLVERWELGVLPLGDVLEYEAKFFFCNLSVVIGVHVDEKLFDLQLAPAHSFSNLSEVFMSYLT